MKAIDLFRPDASPAPIAVIPAAPPLADARDVRIQVDVPAEFAVEMENLKDMCGFGSKRETVVAALSSLMWIAREILSGNRVGSLDSTGTKFTEMMPVGAKLMPHFLRNSQSARART